MVAPYAPNATTGAHRTTRRPRWPWWVAGALVLAVGVGSAEHLWFGPNATHQMCGQARVLSADLDTAPAAGSPLWDAWYRDAQRTVRRLDSATKLDSQTANGQVERYARLTVAQWGLATTDPTGSGNVAASLFSDNLALLDAACHQPG